jgi:aryl-alcohol dehydrogenase-like predicted oxidoreductase
LAKGLLTGKYHDRPESGVLSDERYARFLTDRNWQIVDDLREFAAARHVPMVQVSLAWLIHRPTVPAVIPGAMNPDQVRGNAGAGRLDLSSQDLADLETIVGPASA